MIQKALTDEPVSEGRRRTPYGRIQFPVDRLAEAQFAAGPHQIDTVIGVNGDRFSGFLVDPVLTLRPQLGPSLTLRRDLVTRLALGARKAVPARRASGLVFLLRNGDTFSGDMAGGTIRLTTPYLDVRIALEEIESVGFGHDQPLLATLRCADGRSAEGLLRIARSGSWLYGARACRSANRDSYGESTRSSDLGFRVVLAPVDP
jgi:hypothetical protein